MSFRKKVKAYAEVPITRHLVLEMLSEYKRPHDKISELLKHKKLISVKRDPYVTSSSLDLPSPEAF